MTIYTGNDTSETLNSTNWDYSWDTFVMHGGNDRVSTPSTGTTYNFYGLGGDDYFKGDTGNDYISGGNDNDHLSGNHGSDTIHGDYGDDKCFGGIGDDYLNGFYGNDRLVGGKDKDHYDGGGAIDYFVIGRGHSYSSKYEADVIYDWNVSVDYIDSPLHGTAGNYGEKAASVKSIEGARNLAENANLQYKDHAFIYNADTDTGYLLSDLDSNGSFETGVILQHAGSASDMNWSDIV